MTENEILHEQTINVAPVPANVHLKTIVVEPGGWEEHVGADGECEEVYRTRLVYNENDEATRKPYGRRLGIVFLFGGNWAIAADGHEMYETPGRSQWHREDAIYWLAKMNQIVTNDSPKTTWRPA